MTILLCIKRGNKFSVFYFICYYNNCQSGEMSLSISSFYEQTPALNAIQQKIQNSFEYDDNSKSAIREIVDEACNLTMPECYRLVSILAKQLKSSNTIQQKYIIMFLVKQMFLTARHHFYIFCSIKILPWIKSIASFQNKKNTSERVRLYMQQVEIKGNGDEVIQQRNCYKMLNFVDEFLDWFSLNFPYHLNAIYEFSSTFKRSSQGLGNYQKQEQFFQYFSDLDFQKFQKNFNILKCESSLQIRELCQFVGLELRATVDQKKKKSQVLKELIKTADSYCIRAIVSELASFLEDEQKFISCIQIINYLSKTGEIEFNELVKLYCLPLIIEYILPISFCEGKRVERVPRKCQPEEEKYAIDSIYVWDKQCEELELSRQFYALTLKQMEEESKPILNIKKKHYSDFLTNLIDMRQTNKQKNEYVRNQQIENELIAIISIKKQKEMKSEIERVPVLWKSNISAIQELENFQQSKAKNTHTNPQYWKSKVSNSNNIRAHNKFFESQTVKPTTKLAQEQIESPNIRKLDSGLNYWNYSMKELSDSKQNQLKKQNSSASEKLQESSGSQIGRQISIKLPGYQNLNNPSNSSYVGFQASKMSSFSEVSVNRSDSQRKVLEKSKSKKNIFGRIKDSFNKLRGSSNDKSSQKSQSVVYFTNSQDFHSQSRIRPGNRQSPFKDNVQKIVELKQPDNENMLMSQMEYMIGQFNPKNEGSCKMEKSQSKSKNSQSGTIYFRNSLKDSHTITSQATSKITQYGMVGNSLPSPTTKPKFGFREKNKPPENILNQIETRRQRDILENILSSRGSQCVSNQNHFKNSIQSRANPLVGSRQISQIRKKNNTSHNYLHISRVKSQEKLTSYQKLMDEVQQKKSEYEESSSEIRGYIVHKYHLTESRDFKNFVLQKEKRMDSQGQNLKIGSKKQSNKIIMEEYGNDKLMQLEQAMGRVKRQKQEKAKKLREKQEEYKAKRNLAELSNQNRKKLVNLKKETQVLELLSLQKNKEEYNFQSNQGNIIKPISNKLQIQDFFLSNEVKGLYSPYAEPFDHIFIKQLLGSRCLLLKNNLIEIGYNYSQRQNEISLYLTLIKAYDQIHIKIQENSISLDEEVKLDLRDIPARNQLKIKRKVTGIKEKKKDPTFSQIIHQNPSHIIVYPQLLVTMKESEAEENFAVRIPCSVFNLALPIQITSEIIGQLRSKKVVKSPPLSLNPEFVVKMREKIKKYFPSAVSLSEGWCLAGYQYKQKIFGTKMPEFIKFRIDDRQIQFEFFGDPKTPLMETLVCLLAG